MIIYTMLQHNGTGTVLATPIIVSPHMGVRLVVTTTHTQLMLMRKGTLLKMKSRAVL